MFICDLHQLQYIYVDKHLVGGQFYYLHQRHEYSDVDGERAVKVVQLKRKMHFLAANANTMLSREVNAGETDRSMPDWILN